jgi:hypothetical protein
VSAASPPSHTNAQVTARCAHPASASVDCPALPAPAAGSHKPPCRYLVALTVPTQIRQHGIAVMPLVRHHLWRTLRAHLLAVCFVVDCGCRLGDPLRPSRPWSPATPSCPLFRLLKRYLHTRPRPQKSTRIGLLAPGAWSRPPSRRPRHLDRTGASKIRIWSALLQLSAQLSHPLALRSCGMPCCWAKPARDLYQHPSGYFRGRPAPSSQPRRWFSARRSCVRRSRGKRRSEHWRSMPGFRDTSERYGRDLARIQPAASSRFRVRPCRR